MAGISPRSLARIEAGTARDLRFRNMHDKQGSENEFSLSTPVTSLPLEA